DARIALRFANASDLQYASNNELLGKHSAQPSQALFFKNSLQFVRRAGQQQNALPSVVLMCNPQAGSGAVGIGQNDSSGNYVRLLVVIGAHLPAARRG